MYGGKLRKVKFRYKGYSVEAILDRLPTAQIISEDNGEYVIQAAKIINSEKADAGIHVQLLEGQIPNAPESEK